MIDRAAGFVAEVCDIIADLLELSAGGPAPEWTRGAGESNLRWGIGDGGC